MDMGPFSSINPCGFPGLAVTQLKDHNVTESVEIVAKKLTFKLCEYLDYKNRKIFSNDV